MLKHYDMSRYPSPKNPDTDWPWTLFWNTPQTPEELRKMADKIEKREAERMLRLKELEDKLRDSKNDRMVKELEEQGYRVHRPGWAPD